MVEVALDQETVWLSQQQMADLFQQTKQNISLHISNLFKENELVRNSVVKKYLTTARDGKNYQVEYYNLDVIISVGYRVKSPRGTNFRIWATNILRNHLIEKVKRNAISSSEEKYRQLVQVIEMATQTADTQDLTAQEAHGILKILREYAYALETLDKYDHQRLEIGTTVETGAEPLGYEEAMDLIRE